MPSSPASPEFTVSHGGAVRGECDGEIERFLGVPYAAAPVAELRFAAPAPATWAGVRPADAPGPNAPQSNGPRAMPGLDLVPLVDSGWREGDDFLTLNLWRPVGASAAPVMVFIHGGGFVGGSKDAAVHDGGGFARSGVVCVAINYRLGVEGFLPLPGAPTNLGLRDMLAALRWVQNNAAAFGGDPANVTVFGESAGAMAIADLIASPMSKGLFRRAIVQSGHGAMVRSLPVARKLVRRLARLLGVKPTAAGFRERTAAQAVAALEKVSQPTARIDLREADGREPAFGLSRFLPVWGDDVLPESPLAALAKGAGAEIDLLIGTNREEMNIYFVPTGVRAKIGRMLARVLLGRALPKAGAVLEAYGWRDRARKPGDVFTEALHDLVFRWPARRFAETHRGRTHMYDFGWCSPACGGALGACHGVELPFVFDTLASVTGPNGLVGEAPPLEAQALADRVHSIWVEFARRGAAPWPEYAAADRQVFDLVEGRARAEPPMPAAPFLP